MGWIFANRLCGLRVRSSETFTVNYITLIHSLFNDLCISDTYIVLDPTHSFSKNLCTHRFPQAHSVSAAKAAS